MSTLIIYVYCTHVCLRCIYTLQADMTYIGGIPIYMRATHTHSRILYNYDNIIYICVCARPISVLYRYCVYSIYLLLVNRVRNRSVCNCRYTAHGAVYFMYVIFRFSSFRLFKFYGLFLKYIYYVASARPGLTLTNIYDPRRGRTDGRGTAAVYFRRVRI